MLRIANDVGSETPRQTQGRFPIRGGASGLHAPTLFLGVVAHLGPQLGADAERLISLAAVVVTSRKYAFLC
jgi:hypothetical protein